MSDASYPQRKIAFWMTTWMTAEQAAWLKKQSLQKNAPMAVIIQSMIDEKISNEYPIDRSELFKDLPIVTWGNEWDDEEMIDPTDKSDMQRLNDWMTESLLNAGWDPRLIEMFKLDDKKIEELVQSEIDEIEQLILSEQQ